MNAVWLRSWLRSPRAVCIEPARRPSVSPRPAPTGYPRIVADKVWTAEELERLSPAEQDAVFEASLVTDLSAVPPEFMARIRQRVQERIDSTEASSKP